MLIDKNLEQIINFSKKNNINNSIIISFSGGADSLLCALIAKNYFKKVYLFFVYDHYEPGLLIVKELAIKINAELIIYTAEKPYYIHINQTARIELLNNLTYTALKYNIKCVWIGHNLDDLIGTFQMRLEQKSTSWGLASISPITLLNTIYICRPILHIKANDIRDYVQNYNYVKHPENTIIAPGYYRNTLNNKLDFSNLNIIIKYQIERKAIQIQIEEWLKNNSIKYNNGSIFINNNIFELQNELLVNRIINYASNYCYINMESDFYKIIHRKKNFTKGGCLFIFKKNGLYIFREALNQNFNNYNVWNFDKRWYTDYKKIECCKCNDNSYASKTIACQFQNNICKHFSYLLPSFICYY